MTGCLPLIHTLIHTVRKVVARELQAAELQAVSVVQAVSVRKESAQRVVVLDVVPQSVELRIVSVDLNASVRKDNV